MPHNPPDSSSPYKAGRAGLRLRGRALRLVEALAGEQERPVEEVLDDLLSAALGLRGARQAPPVWRGLTRREREVLRLILQDCSDRIIAHSLRIDKQTVRSHVRSILRKYGVHSRADLRRRIRLEGGLEDPAASPPLPGETE